MIKSTCEIPVNLIPENDALRLEHVARYEILDTANEESFDKIGRLAALIFNVPNAFITFVDDDRVFFKTNISKLDGNVVPRNLSLCSIAIHHDCITVFNDTHDFPQLLSNPFCNGVDGIRFYAGAPLRTPEGTQLGTVCVTDSEPRLVTERQLTMLATLSAIIMDQLSFKLQINQLKKS